MITTTHVRLDQAILQMHHWFHQRQDQENDLEIYIADAENMAQGIKASTLRAMGSLTGGSAIDALFLLWCAGGVREVVEVDATGEAKPPIAWRGQAMIDYIERVGLSELYTPHFRINTGTAGESESVEVDADTTQSVSDRFDPVSLAQIRAEFCKTDTSRKWFDNAANRPAPWVKSARLARNSYDPQQIAEGFVSKGQLDKGAAYRILKRLLPDRSRHLEHYYE